MSEYNSAGYAKPPTCPYCGCMPEHSIEQCPRVSKIEYYQDGRIKSVEKRP